MNGELYATIVALVLLICYGLMRRDHASWGPDGEKPSRVRPGESPTEAPVVSGGTHLNSSLQSGRTDPGTLGAECGGIASRETKPGLTGAGVSIQLEQAPACDRAPDLSHDTDSTNVLLAGRSPVVVRSTAAGAPAVIYRWVRPAEGKKMAAHGWWLEHVDPRYGTWLVKKEERWP